MSAWTRAACTGQGAVIASSPAAPNAPQTPASFLPIAYAATSPSERDEHERDPDPLDAVARQQGQSLQQDVEAGRLRRVDVRPQLLPVAQGVERGEVDALVVVRGRLHAPDVDERCDREQPGQPERLAEPTPRGQGTVTVTGFESRKTSPSSGSSIQFAAAPTLYVHVPGPGRSTALVFRSVFSSTDTSVQRSAPSPSVKQR